ncbi:MAG: hypothetical protein HRT61_08850 [Ekhidna sp.]|nr:hypothetical protein [Ekhidna sp.]
MKKVLHVIILLSAIQVSAQERVLQKDSLIIDLELLERMLKDVHPGTYRYMTEAELETQMDLLMSSLPDKISEGQFMIRLAKLVSQVKCGHTYLNPWNMRADVRQRLFGGKRYLPFGFDIIDGRFYVTENVDTEPSMKKGAEVLSLNGITTQVIMDSLRKVSKIDGNNTAPVDFYFSLNEYGMRTYEAFDLYYSLFFPSLNEQVEVAYQNYNSPNVDKKMVSLLTKQERLDKVLEKYGEEPINRKKWSLDIVNKDLAIMKIGTFAIWNWDGFKYKAWFKEAFEKLADENVSQLIVDIRGNGGGLGEPRDELMAYLVKEKVRMANTFRSLIRTKKLDEDLHEYSDTWNKAILTGLPESMYQPFDDKYFALKAKDLEKTIKPKKNGFKGDVYLFGDGSNTSATFQLFTLAKEHGFAKVIGSESGGNQQGTNGNQYIFFYMPYSDMEVDIPLIFSQATSDVPDAGLMPDIEVRKSQETIALDQDPAVNYILKGR